MSGDFTVADITEQIEEHIAHRGNTDTISLLWRGHLAALFYGDSLDFDEFLELLILLKPVGREELNELFSKLMNDPKDRAKGLFKMFADYVEKEGADDPVGRDALIMVMEHVFGLSQGKAQD